MRQVMTIEEAQAWLEQNPYGKLKCLYNDWYAQAGKPREATISHGVHGIIVHKPGCSRWGHFIEWGRVVKVWLQKIEPKNETAKFIKKAALATFTNDFIRKCLAADPAKSPYENGLSTGVPIEGKIISLKSFGLQHPYYEQEFRKALKERRTFHSPRVPFRGYEATLELWWEDEAKTELSGCLSLEYKDCGNGYYYLLINDDEFIGYDID